jgi:hypothetical protein
MGYLTKGPSSNEVRRETSNTSPWLEENELMDEIALLLNGMAKRCVKCRRSTRTNHLDQDQRCPDCRG